MLKKLTLISLIVVVGLFVYNVQKVEGSGVPTKSPKLLALKYLRQLAKYIEEDVKVLNPQSPKDSDKFLLIRANLTLEKQFNDIASAVGNYFENKGIWSLEGVYKAVEEAIKQTKFKGVVDEATSKWGNEFDGLSQDTLNDMLDGNLNTPSKDKTRIVTEVKVYSSKTTLENGIVIDSVGIENVETKVVKKKRSIKNWLKDWWIERRKGGAIIDDLGKAIGRVGKLKDNKALNNYFDKGSSQDGFDMSKWSNVSTALYWSQAANILDNYTGQDFYRDGVGFLKEQAEAVINHNIKDDQMLSDVSDLTGIDIINKMIKARSRLLEPLNKFYDTTLSVLDPADVGKISSWADGVFGRLKKFNYDKADKEWKKKAIISFDQALSDVKNMIGYATDIADDVGKFYGINTSAKMRREQSIQGQHVRNMLTQWAFNIQDIVDYSGDKEGALKLVSDILNTESKRGIKLLNKFKSFWKSVEASFSLEDKSVQGAYAGLVKMVPTILSQPSYFGIGKGNIGDAYDKMVTILDKAVNQKDSNGNTIMDLTAQYLTMNDKATSKDLDFEQEKGYQTGVATFWAEVLEAKKEELGSYDKAFNYIHMQLEARREIADYLDLKTPLGLDPHETSVDNDILTLFEKPLEGAYDQQLVDASVERVKDIIDQTKFSAGHGAGQNTIENREEVNELIEEAEKKISEPIFPKKAEVEYDSVAFIGSPETTTSWTGTEGDMSNSATNNVPSLPKSNGFSGFDNGSLDLGNSGGTNLGGEGFAF